MVKNNIRQWFFSNKKGLIIGFIFGSVIAPFLASLGLGIALFEVLRLFLIAPMDLIGNLIPNVQVASNTFYVPAYKWILALGFNGICYAVLGGIVEGFVRRR